MFDKKNIITSFFILFLFSCSYMGFNDDFFSVSNKNDLWGKLCNFGVDSGVIYEKDNLIYNYTGHMFLNPSNSENNNKSELIEAIRGVVLMPSKCNSVPEKFLKSNSWRWRPKQSTIMYEIIFENEKVIKVNKMMMK